MMIRESVIPGVILLIIGSCLNSWMNLKIFLTKRTFQQIYSRIRYEAGVLNRRGDFFPGFFRVLGCITVARFIRFGIYHYNLIAIGLGFPFYS